MRRPSPYDLTLGIPWQPVTVRCRSDYRYAQEPQALLWEGTWHPVARIVARWHTPTGPAFRLVSAEGALYEVQYREDEDRWVGRQL